MISVTMPRCSSTIILDLDTPERSKMVLASISPEKEDEVGRTSSELAANGSKIVVTIDSDDLVALHASMTAWLRLLDVASAVAE